MEESKQEFERYNIHDAGQFLITGVAAAIFLIVTKAFDFPFGIFKALLYMIPYSLGLAALMAVNAFGIMIEKKGHMIGSYIALLTYGGLFALFFFTHSSLGL